MSTYAVVLLQRLNSEVKMERANLTLLREIGWHRAQNRFYRECYPLLKYLQDAVEQAIEGLLLLYYSPSSVSMSYDSIVEIKNMLERISEETLRRESEATLNLNELWHQP
jgi:hypothetical protein